MPRDEDICSKCSASSKDPWPKAFSEDRNPAEEASVLEAKLKLNPTDDHLLCILRDYDEETAEEEVIMGFCAGVHLSALTNPNVEHRGAAWLDDRLCIHSNNTSRPTAPFGLPSAISNSNLKRTNLVCDASDNCKVDTQDRASLPDTGKGLLSTFREYNGPLDALTLLWHLSQKRFRHANLPDADRRLIYVLGLDPMFVYALLETATQHQIAALKDTLYMHISRKAGMGVRLSYNSYEIFELYLYLPFPVWKTPGDEETRIQGPNNITGSNSIDISFISEGHASKQSEGPQIIRLSHIALNICGVADHRWTGLAFVDGDDEMSDEDFDYNTMIPDPFAASGDVDANHPIWNPREYYLRIASIRIEAVIRKWARLIHKIENSNSEAPLDSINPFNQRQSEAAMVIFRRTQRAVRAVGRLLDVLSETNAALSNFSAPTGDIRYFEHTQNLAEASRKQMDRCLLDLRSKFPKMRALQTRLEKLERLYQRDIDSLERYLATESFRIATSSGHISELMVSLVSPAAIVSAFFAIPEPFGSFPRTGGSFAIAMVIVTGVLQSCILFQRKGWRMRIPGLGFFLEGGLRQDQAELVDQPRHRPRLALRTDTTATLVDHPGV